LGRRRHVPALSDANDAGAVACGLWVHSPIAPDEKLLRAVDALGPVRHIISSNKIHHVSIGPWAETYPDARLWASPGVRARSEVTFTDDLAETPPDAWSAVIDQRIARGSKALEEVVFFHKPSRTLILTDLIENFEASLLRKGFWLKILMRLGGVMAPRGGVPRDIRLSFLGNHRKLRPVVQWMLNNNPQKVVISHGKWFEVDGRDIIRRAFSWVGGVE